MKSLLLLALCFAFPLQSLAQDSSAAVSGYRSQIDESFLIRQVTLMPFSDNVGGIYARPLEAELTKALKESHRFNFADFSSAQELPSLDDLEEQPQKVQELTRGPNAEALLAAKLSKGPRGISITLDLFLANDGKLLLQETLRDHPRFEIGELKEKMKSMYQNMLARLPYKALVLSRIGNKVTLNLGSRDGVRTGAVVNAILILKAQRHPKFQFLISSEKEILGKIRLTKVDETLSFGSILTEADKDSIRKGTKIADLESVVYRDEETERSISSLDESVDPTKDNPEWIPIQPPTFGLVGLHIGTGTYSHKTTIDTVAGLQGRSPLYPELKLNAELWLTSKVILRAALRQGIATFKNPREGSSPSDLTTVVSSYSLGFGYSVLMRNDFFGPKLTVLGGLYQYRASIDHSQPAVFTSMTYSAPFIGLEGFLPLDEAKIWAMSVGLQMMFQPTLNEAPETSGGSSKNTVDRFYLSGRKKIGENLHAVGTIDFESYRTSFSGAGSRPETVSTDSQTSTVLSGGIHYLF